MQQHKEIQANSENNLPFKKKSVDYRRNHHFNVSGFISSESYI
jgi:hypothetical protein